MTKKLTIPKVGRVDEKSLVLLDMDIRRGVFRDDGGVEHSYYIGVVDIDGAKIKFGAKPNDASLLNYLLRDYEIEADVSDFIEDEEEEEEE